MSKAQILVVEDEGITAKHLQKTLEVSGYTVPDVVATGPDAIEKAGSSHPDLVLMDIILKGEMDGIEAADQIRSLYNIPVIYLTANADAPTFQRAQMTEPLGYILKPFSEQSLNTRIEIALYKHEIARQIKQHTEELEALHAVSRILAQQWSFEDKSRGILEALTQISCTDLSVIRVFEPDTNNLKIVCKIGPDAWECPEEIPVDQSISGEAFNKREPVIIDDYPSHSLADSNVVSQGIQSVISVPIRANQHTLGVVNLLSRNPNHFSPKLASLFSGIADGLGAL